MACAMFVNIVGKRRQCYDSIRRFVTLTVSYRYRSYCQQACALAGLWPPSRKSTIGRGFTLLSSWVIDNINYPPEIHHSFLALNEKWYDGFQDDVARECQATASIIVAEPPTMRQYIHAGAAKINMPSVAPASIIITSIILIWSRRHGASRWWYNFISYLDNILSSSLQHNWQHSMASSSSRASYVFMSLLAYHFGRF